MTLVYVAPGPLRQRGGAVNLTRKTVEGMVELARLWPEDVTLLAPGESGGGAAHNLGESWVDPSGLPFAVVVTTDLRAALARLRPSVSLISLGPEHEDLVGIADRTVATVEHTGRSRLEMARPGITSVAGRARAEIGFRRLDRRLRAMAARVDGLQCCGEVAVQAFLASPTSTMSYLDSRLREEHIDRAQARRSGRTPSALRLGFSGRLISIKGPEYAVQLVSTLRERGHPARLVVFGDGEQRDQIRRLASADVELRGSIDFPEPWCERVVEDVDLMVLPHIQPDPAGTLLESAGVGAPVLGFRTLALDSLIRDGAIGWSVPLGDVAALADVVERLVADPAELAAASTRSMDFMRGHTFELEFARRVQHLHEVLALPRRSR